MGSGRTVGGIPLPPLYAILDYTQLRSRSAPRIAQALVDSGVRLIQYRDKEASSRQLFDRSQAIQEILKGRSCHLIVNDRADIARLIGAWGVHLGQDDLPAEMARGILLSKQILGVSTHTIDQAARAEASCADYVAIGPIFATMSKDQPDPVVGLEGLRQVRRVIQKPLVAIGGITLENAQSVIAAGADSVAVIRDLMEAPDVGRRAEEFLRALERCQRMTSGNVMGSD